MYACRRFTLFISVGEGVALVIRFSIIRNTISFPFLPLIRSETKSKTDYNGLSSGGTVVKIEGELNKSSSTGSTYNVIPLEINTEHVSFFYS